MTNVGVGGPDGAGVTGAVTLVTELQVFPVNVPLFCDALLKVWVNVTLYTPSVDVAEGLEVDQPDQLVYALKELVVGLDGVDVALR